MEAQFNRPEVLALVPQEARRVLDVGCGAGFLGADLKARQAWCEVVGIEVDVELAAQAETRLDQVYCMDVERMAGTLGVLPNPDATRADFDAIVCADVLEHLHDPAMVLHYLHSLLTPQGSLIISAPNARNWQILAGLIEGDFCREPVGLLDRSHLQFFTLREVQKLLDQCSFGLEREHGIPGHGYQGWVDGGKRGGLKFGRWEIVHLSEEEATDFYVYQWLFVARPRRPVDYGLTSIIIPVWNGCADTVTCLESVRKHTPEAHEIIVVDNGSTDQTAGWLAQQPGLRVITNEANRGFPAACNQGIAAAQGSQVLLLNNDTVVTPGWLRRLVECLQSGEDVGMVGPRTNVISGVQQIAKVQYENLAELDGYAWGWSAKRFHEYLPTQRLTGFCLMIGRACLEKVGGFDEQFGIGCYEDDDYGRRAEAAGFRLLIANDCFIHHSGSSTFRRELPDRFQALLDENLVKFQAKWEGKT